MIRITEYNEVEETKEESELEEVIDLLANAFLRLAMIDMGDGAYKLALSKLEQLKKHM